MRHRVERIRWPVAAVVGVLVVGSGTAYAVTRDGSSAHYRTVLATTADVEQVLSTSGTVDAAHRADLGFGASGTVASVAVAVGDTVRVGQVVARLDATSLAAAVTRARAAVAKALAQLETDRTAQAQAVSDAAATPKPKQTGKPTSPTPSGSTSGASAATLQQLKDQQDAVLQAQSAATTAIAAAKDALAAQTTACADAYQGQAPAGGGDQSTPATGPADTACAAALAEVQARQTAVSAAQDDLQQALDTLAGTLSRALASLSGSSNASPNAAPSGAARASSGSARSATSSSTSTSTSTPNGASSGTVSAARLASDQAAIEKAQADLVDARQQLRQAVLRSTRSGRVVSVPVTAGDRVAAGDVGAVVVGGRAVTVVASVAQDKISRVAVGEHVRVTTPGQSGAADGTVSAIGLVADSSSGTPSYAVTVTVEDPAISLPAGSQALLGIVVATAKDVVTVPTSAITRRGTQATVRTWDGRTLTRKTVTLGTVGARQVEITAGLAAGDRVVLADIDQPITGAANSINDRGGFSGPVNFKGGGRGLPPVTFGTPSK